VVRVLAWKLRIVVLWISLAVCQSASTYLALLQPGAVRDLLTGHLAGEDVQSAGVQVYTLLSWVVPMVMAYLTLVLRDADNRNVNAVLGGGGALNGVTALFTNQGGATAAGVVVAMVGVLVPLLILWHAWKWPRPDEVRVGESREGERRRPTAGGGR
jgi:hypothetical protein